MKTFVLVIGLLLSQAVYAQQGNGTPGSPIVAMSADPAQIARDVRASLAFYGRTDDAYWIGISNHPTGPFSNGLWYLGWNKYWEDRADPMNTGAANPSDAGLPALHRDVASLPVPPSVPVPSPTVTLDLSMLIQTVGSLQAQIESVSAQNERIFANLTAQISAVNDHIAAVDTKFDAYEHNPPWLQKILTNKTLWTMVATAFGTWKLAGK
jgi:hypothetical protein